MPAICMYFQVHQPMRLRRIKTFDAVASHAYWDDARNREIMERAADKCYLPANRMLLELIRQSEGAFRVAFSISGTFLEQAERFRPDVVESFRDLARTGHVEFLAETYYHSLAGLWDDPDEFYAQVDEHRRCMQRVLGVSPTVFRNTELIYDDRIAQRVQALGYEGMLTEGTEKILGQRSPNHPYTSSCGLPVLLKNYRLSDDVAFRFSAHGWEGHPLTAEKYATWLAGTPGDSINLFMDFETFGEHQWKETGIFDFLWHLPREVARHPGLRFALPSEVLRSFAPAGQVDAPWAISWADEERDVSAWLGNRMQVAAFERLKSMAPLIQRAADPDLEHAWRLLQTSDHLYYASTKALNDGDVHAYFSPYDSPYLAYINHINAIEHLREQAVVAAEAPSVVTMPDPGEPEEDKTFVPAQGVPSGKAPMAASTPAASTVSRGPSALAFFAAPGPRADSAQAPAIDASRPSRAASGATDASGPRRDAATPSGEGPMALDPPGAGGAIDSGSTVGRGARVRVAGAVDEGASGGARAGGNGADAGSKGTDALRRGADAGSMGTSAGSNGRGAGIHGGGAGRRTAGAIGPDVGGSASLAGRAPAAAHVSRRALVTGGAGFIGSNVVARLLADGWDVHVVDDLLTGRRENVPSAVPFTFADVASDAFPGSLGNSAWDLIVHLAGASSAPMFDEETSRASQAVRGFQKVLDLARDSKAKVAFASTSSLYSRCQKPYHEEMAVRPATLYEFSKLAMEQLAATYAARYGVDSVALRFFSVYGPNEQGKGRFANVVSQFMWSMQRGIAPVVYGDGQQTRDFTHVDDVVDGLLTALDHAHGFEVYNVGTGTEHTFNDLVERLNAALGTHLAPRYVPNPVHNYIQETLAETGRLRALGWRPKVGLDDGIARLVGRADPVDDQLLQKIAA